MSATTIADALAQIYRIEGALEVTAPFPAKVRKVWDFYPPPEQVVTSNPAFINTYGVREVRYESALQRVFYSVHARLAIEDKQAPAIASSFIQPIIAAFASNIKLGMSEWQVQTVRFNGEQPTQFADLSAAAGKSLIGLDFYIDLIHSTTPEFAVGDPPL